MAATSLYNDVLLDTSERPIALMPTMTRWWVGLRARRWPNGSTSIVLSGTPRMDETEELSALYGRPWKWKDSTSRPEKKIREP